MQVSIEDVNTVKKILHIEVPEEKVVSDVDAAYNKLKKTAKVNGFRTGKAPRAVLERKFKSDVHADVVSHLVQTTLFEAIQENKLKYIGEPVVDMPDFDPKSAYKFSATLELMPELGPIDFSGIQIKKTMYEPSENEVDAQLEMIRKNLAKRVALDEVRAAQQNDYVLIDYEGLKDGQPFDATPKVENTSHKIGSAVFSNDFDDQLVGMQPGEVKVFDVVYADTYVNKALAGNTLSFTVKLNAIQHEVLPELDDEFAKRVGDFETLDALRDAIMDNLKSGYDKRMEQELNEQVHTNLIEKVSFEVPDLMVQYELASIIAEAEKAFMMNGISLEQIGKTREDLEKEYGGLAEKQVRRHLILGALIKQEKIDLTDEEMEAGFEETAKAIHQPVEGIRAFYKSNPDKIEYFKHTLLEKKALKLIIDNSVIEEIKPELEDASQE
ncbi:MAG: trigger factor [Proteobacteria bacterium]|nr:trigger factor [Pseudomonadota bacterium]